MDTAKEILERVKNTNDLMNLSKKELLDYALAVTMERNELQRGFNYYREKAAHLTKMLNNISR